MIAMAEVAPDQAPPTAPPQSNEAQFTAGRRAAMLAGLQAASGSAAVPTPGAPPAETPATTPEEKPAPPAEAPKPAPEPQPDETAAIRKQEIHLRRQIAEERQQWQAEQARKEAEFKPRLEKLEQFEQRLAAAKDDPIAYLQAGGWTEAEFDQLARFVHAHSPEGAKDPRNKTAAHQTKAQRDYEAKLAKLEERQTAFERREQEQREAAEARALEDDYYGSITKAVGDESPIVRARLAAAPDVARARMLTIADKLYTDSGPSDDLRDVPEPAQIIKAYEDERRADLETDLRALPAGALRALLTKLGVDPATVLRPTDTAAPPAGAPAPRPSTTLSPGGGSPTQAPPKGRMTREQLIAETRRLNELAKT